jgi:hypothetical protein
MRRILLCLAVFFIATICNLTAQIPYPGKDPGDAVLNQLEKGHLILENEALKIKFISNGQTISINRFEDKNTNEKIDLENVPVFELWLLDNNQINSNNFTLIKPPAFSNVDGDINALKYANKLSGKKYSADFINENLGLKVHWEAQLRDGSNYVQQVLTFETIGNATVTISQINLIRIPISSGIRKAGIVDGVPMVHKNMFFSIEYPMSKTENNGDDLVSYVPRATPITPSDPFTVSSVWGITPENQLRRGFLYYMERERAAPYHQMSFYNSWGDIAWMDRKMSERACLERIKWIGDSLIIKRNINLNAFLFDDGWDDNRTLWNFHSAFPNGFTKMKEEAEAYGSTLGVWISPFGGYGNAKKLRMEYGRKQNPPFETNEHGFSLSGMVYYKRYKEVLVDFVKKYDITMLKFDGVAGNNLADMEAYLNVTKEIRDVKPDMYFCLTTGTWPSPFFLKYGDCVWRGGGDYGYTGEGSNRQRWITYRDADVYKNIVKRSPLYPLNGLQQMGIFISDLGEFGEFGMNQKDLSDDIWTALATGTAVQGMYINAYRMNSATWDCLANALAWAKENESVMADIHWVGGDPAKGEIYGFAAWSPGKAILSLRNPTSEIKDFEINVADVFELPDNMPTTYLFYDVKERIASGNDKPLKLTESFKITLQPFEVKIFDAFPRKE